MIVERIANIPNYDSFIGAINRKNDVQSDTSYKTYLNKMMNQLTKQKIIIVNSKEYEKGLQELKDYVASQGLPLGDKEARTLYNLELQMDRHDLPFDISVLKQLTGSDGIIVRSNKNKDIKK